MSKIYYDSLKDKICQRGCGVRIVWKGKIEDKKGSTGWIEYGTTIEHTYKRCDTIMKNNQIKAQHGKLF